MMAARLYQNASRVHFNALAERGGRFGRRIAYGGHVMSIARALSFNGLANAFHVTAINAGRHVAPVFAGDTVHAWTTVAGKIPLEGRERRRRAPPHHPRHQERQPRLLSHGAGVERTSRASCSSSTTGC